MVFSIIYVFTIVFENNKYLKKYLNLRTSILYFKFYIYTYTYTAFFKNITKLLFSLRDQILTAQNLTVQISRSRRVRVIHDYFKSLLNV